MTKQPKVLVADDQRDILTSISLLLKSEGIDSVMCDTPASVLEQIKKYDFDVLLLDMNFQADTTSGSEGLQLIKQVSEISPSVVIVAMTAWASIDVAVEAMKRGARDFVTKPLDSDRLITTIKTQTDLRRALCKQQALQAENALLREEKVEPFVAEAPAMTEIIATFKQIAPSDVRVLITGENGTGKTLLAHLCHQMSNRASGPFISVNVGGLAENLFESEIFGHQKGAYTGATEHRIGRYELADGGTLFLDEVGVLSDAHQIALLRLLESGEFERVGSSKTRTADVRIICATNEDLAALVRAGKFREDLFYRINTIAIKVPALRERRCDILPLAREYLQKYQHRYCKDPIVLGARAEQALLSYDWPGNVRELDHAMERAVLLASNDQLDHESFLFYPPADKNLSIEEMTLAQVERHLLSLTLVKYRKKPDAAANALGISRSAFYRKLTKHQLM